MTPRDADALRRLGINPDALPPGTKIDGRPAEEKPVRKPKPPTDLRDTFLALWKELTPPDAPIPETEFAFCRGRKWRFDVAFPWYKVAVELEGGLWVKSRHRTGSGYQQDCEKYNRAVMDGWRVLRYTADDLRERPAQVVEEVSRILGL